MKRLLTAAALLMALSVTSAAPAAGAQPVAPHPPDPSQSSPAVRAAATGGVVFGGRPAVVITVALSATPDTPATVPDLTPGQVEARVIEGTRPRFQQASHGAFAGYFVDARGPVSAQTRRCARQHGSTRSVTRPTPRCSATPASPI